MGESNFNLPTGLLNILQGAMGTTETTAPGQQPAQTPGDSISGTDAWAQLLTSGSSDGNPQLTPPDTSLIFSNSYTTPTTTQTTTTPSSNTQTPTSTDGSTQNTDSTNVEQMVNNLFMNYPEMSEFTTLSKSIKGQSTDPVQQLKSTVMQALQNTPPPITPNKLQELVGGALAKAILNLINSGGSSEQQPLEDLLNQVRINNFTLNYPIVQVVIDLAYHQALSSGSTPEEATAQANAQVLNGIDNNLSEAGVDQTVLVNNSQLGSAITKTVSTQLQSVFTEMYGAQTGTTVAAVATAGTTIATNFGASASSFLQNVTTINQTTPPSSNLKAQMTKLVTGGLQTINDQVNGIRKAASDLGAPDSGVNSSDWMRLLSLMTSKLESLVNEMQIADSGNMKNIAAAKSDIQQRKEAASLQQIADQIKQIETPAPWWMTLLMVFFAVVVAVVSVVLSPFSGGASLALLIAVTAVVLAVTTALQQTGILSQGISDLLDAIADLCKAFLPSSVAKAIAAAIMVIAMIVITVVTAGAGSGIAADISEALGESISANLIKSMVIQTGIQLTMMLVTSSQLFQNFAACCTDDPTTQAIISAVLTVAALIVTLGVAMKTASALKDVENIAGEVSSMENVINKLQTIAPIVQGIADLGQAAVTSYQAVISIQQAEVTKEIAELKKIIMLLESLIDTLTQLMTSFQDDVTNLGGISKSLNDNFNNAIQSASQSVSNLLHA